MKKIKGAALIASVLCLSMISSCSIISELVKKEEMKTEIATSVPSEATKPSPTPKSDSVKKPLSHFRAEYKNPTLAYEKVGFSANVTPYSVKPDLSNVENIGRFPNLTENQRRLLASNYFVVTPTDNLQFSYTYEKNEYLEIPSFITTDSILQLYHVFFDQSLRTIEEGYFLEISEKLNTNMLNGLISLLTEAEDDATRTAIEDCIAYFAVSQRLLELQLPDGIPSRSKVLADEEYELVMAHDGITKSPLAGNYVFYESFLPRGHYTKSAELEKYFRALMWYGMIYYGVEEQEGVSVDKSLLKSMVTTYALMTLPEEDGSALWENIYSPTVFYVGSADDLTPFDMWNNMIEVYGDFDLNTLNNGEKMAELSAKLVALNKAKIVNENQFDDGTKIYSGAQFRFMGQRYIPDSEIMQRLSEPMKRPVPSGLDVAAVLGADNAEEYVKTYLNPTATWPEYTKEYKKVKREFSELSEETWRSNMYYGWLWTIDALFDKPGDGYPEFMKNPAWYDKQLSTGLGSWAELRHDTVLYAKPSGAEMGGGIEEYPKGYVEPNVALYERLKWLTDFSIRNLSIRGLLDENLRMKAESISEKLGFLIEVSKKELSNEPLSESDFAQIVSYGGWMENIAVRMATDDQSNSWWEVTSETDRNMAIVADVHNTTSGYLTEGVGLSSDIFVIVPHEGKLYLARGSVFDYYELFLESKITDEDWQTWLTSDNKPERPAWTQSFIDTTGIGKEIPYAYD